MASMLQLLRRAPLASASRFAGRMRAFSSEETSKRLPLSMLSEDEASLRESVERFARERIAPLSRKMDEESQMDKGLISDLFAQGYMGIEIAEEYGGAGLNFFQACLVVESLAKVDPAVSVAVDVQNTLVDTIINKYATAEQKAKYLPRLATDTVGSFCLSESSSGSDAFAMKASAKEEKDYYIVNGSKAWITNAEHAGLFLVFANTDFSKGYKGITCFIVEKDTPGLSVGKKEDKLGIRASSTCTVTLEDVKIPKSQIIGQVGQGYKIAIGTLNEGRIGIGAQMVGLAQGAFDLTMPYLNERVQFGKPIAEFQMMQMQYAEMATSIQAARLLVYEAARAREAGQDVQLLAAQAKWYSSEVAGKVSRKCLELWGGMGFVKDSGVERFYRDSVIGSIYEGTSNINLQTIAKLVSNQYKN